MRYLLLHPTHRKLIRLLRKRVKDGYPIVFTQTDIDVFRAISQESMKMIERHQRIYRLLLTAVYRPFEEIDKTEKVYVVREKFINTIENCFARAERQHLGITLLSGYLVPVLQRIVNKRRKRRNKLQ